MFSVLTEVREFVGEWTMKRVFGVFLCVILLLGCVLQAFAAGEVPQEVMDAAKSVVRIVSEYRKDLATGSGFVIGNRSGELLIATNNHVVEDNPVRISVWVSEDRLAEAEVFFASAEKDLCVLRVRETSDMPALPLAVEVPRQGQAVYAVGYPGVGDILSDSIAHTSEDATITDGIISAIRTLTIEEGAEPAKILQFSAAINSGNSGGPLFNAKGEVIGVNTYGVGAQGVFGAVDISELRTLLEQNHIEVSGKTKKLNPVLFLLLTAGTVTFILAAEVILVRAIRKRSSNRGKAVTLREYIQTHPQGLGIYGAVSLLLPVGIALRNLHYDGKLHLEICPENILVGSNGASLKKPSGQEAERFHSGFAAPEIYKGAGYGITSDVYSFGAVLYYAATGKNPANSLQREELETGFSALENAAFGDALRKSMADSTQDRMQSMQELIYSVAVFSVPEEARKDTVPAPILQSMASVPAAEEGPVPIPEPAAEPAKEAHRDISKEKTKKKKMGRILLPIGVVLACAVIGAGILLWKPFAGADHPHMDQGFTETSIYSTPEEAAYAEAEELLAAGETAKAAIAFGKLGDYQDARERSFQLWDKTAYLKTISVADPQAVGIKENGKVVITGAEGWELCNVDDWAAIVEVSAGLTQTLGLKADGTVLSAGRSWSGEGNVGGWADIVSVDAGNEHTVGLKADGTVMAAGSNAQGQCNVGDWTDIVQISAGGKHTVGLKSDGTVVAVGLNSGGQCNVENWSGIVKISAGFWHTAGLKADGTVVTTGGDWDVSGWSNIVEISAGSEYTIGLRSDGTAVGAGRNWDGQCDVGDWTDLVEISAGFNHTIGLKADGTMISTKPNQNGTIGVGTWTHIQLPTKPLPPRS